ncbi:MAG: MG2 domain-containing protein, partial [Tepidisphaerales bacterium]
MTPSTANPAARFQLRFWITVLCFALANLGLWAWYAGTHRTQRRDLLRVERFDPPGTAAQAKLVWKFNLDVQHRRDGAAPAVINPPLAGRFNWADARTLTFVPDGELRPGSHYTITIPADRVASTDGFKLSAPFVSEFSTGTLQLLDVRQSAIEDDRIQLEATFNDAVLPADVQQHLCLSTLDRSAPVPASVIDKEPSKTIRLLVGPLPAMRIDSDECKLRFGLSAGLAGVSGPLATPQAIGCDVTVSPRLLPTGLVAHSPASGPVQLTLSFNGTMAGNVLRPLVSVEPKVPFTISADGHEATLAGDFQPGTRYAVKIAAAPAGSDEHVYPRPMVLSAFIPDRAASLWLDHTDGYLGSAGNRRIMAHATNMSRFKVEITRVYDNNIVVWRNGGSRWSWRNPDSYSEPVCSKVISLPSEKNKPQQIPLSLDELLPPSAPRDGVYRVGLKQDCAAALAGSDRRHSHAYSDDDDGDSDPFVESAAAMVTLSDIALSAKQTRDAVCIWAVSLSKGTPIPQVRVRVYSDKNQSLGEAITDENGLARVGPIVPATGERATIVLAERLAIAPPATRPASLLAAMAALVQPQTRPALAQSGRDLTWLDLQRAQLNLSHADIGGDEYLRKGHEAFVYTERGVYRPGETVHLRAIVRGPDLSVPPAFPVRWQLERPDRVDWKSSVVTLDADGACAFDVELPADLPTGRWKARLQLPGDVREHFGAVSFLVEDYMPDRMKASVSLRSGDEDKPADGEPRRAAEDDGPLTAVVQADYFFGLPADGLGTDLTAVATPVSFEHPAWKQWTFGDAAHLSVKPSVSHRKLDLAPIALDAKGHGEAEVEFDKVLQGQREPGGQRVPRVRREAIGKRRMPFVYSVDGTAQIPGRCWTA